MIIMIDLNYIVERTNAVNLHNIGLTGRGITIALLDSGIDINHDLLKNSKIKLISLIDDEGMDDYGHGTHIVGILLAIAPEVNILSIKVIDSKGETKLSTIMKGLELAYKMGADIINVSVGEQFEGCLDTHPLTYLVDEINSNGILIVASAGNSGPKTSPHIPAGCKNAIAVGSINKYGKTNTWSSRGNICGDKYPDCVAFGDEVISLLPNNRVGELSGTSQSCPQVSGMLALIMQSIKQGLKKEEVEFFLSQSCQWIEKPEKNNFSGWGMIDMEKFFRAVEIYRGKF